MKFAHGLLVMMLLVSCPATFSQTIYDSYPQYYKTADGIFTHLAPLRIEGSRNAVVHWRNQRVPLNQATPFDGEFVRNDDLGSRPVAYVHRRFACIEGKSSSASGTAVRHMSVYLLDATPKKIRAFKLSSLFASCSGVRLTPAGDPLFYDASYIHASESDDPTGVTLREYSISNGKFVPTGRSVVTRFVEPGNVWRFEVVPES